MAESLKPPSPFTSTSDAAKDWPQWRDHLTYYMKSAKKDKEEPATQVAVLLTAMGKEAISVYKTFFWAKDEDKDNLEIVLTAFATTTNQRRMRSTRDLSFLNESRRQVRHLRLFTPIYSDLLRRVHIMRKRKATSFVTKSS